MAASRRTFLTRATLGLGGLWAAQSAGSVAAQQALLAKRVFLIEPPAPGTDSAPAINDAIRKAAAAGGGIIRFAPGHLYALKSIAPGSALSSQSYRSSIVIPAGASDIAFEFNGCTLRQDIDAMTFGIAYRMFNDPEVAMQARPFRGTPMRGDTSVDLETVSGLVPGSVCMLLAGNTVPQPNAYAPIAEMVVAMSVEGQRISFDRPLAKDYMPFGQVAFGKVPHGLIDISRHSCANISLVGPGLIVNRWRRAGNIFQVLGLKVDRVAVEGRGGLGLRGRDLLVTDCSAAIRADWSQPIFRPYCVAFDTGTSHVKLRNFTANGAPNMTYLHLHEGLADIDMDGIEIINGTRFDPAGESSAALSVLSVSWNVRIANCRIVNNPQGSAIRASDFRKSGLGNKGLLMENVTVEGDFRSVPVLVTDENPATIRGLDLKRARASNGAPQIRTSGAHHSISYRNNAPAN